MDKRFPNIIEQHRDPSAFLERLEKINHKMEACYKEMDSFNERSFTGRIQTALGLDPYSRIAACRYEWNKATGQLHPFISDKDGAPAYLSSFLEENKLHSSINTDFYHVPESKINNAYAFYESDCTIGHTWLVKRDAAVKMEQIIPEKADLWTHICHSGACQIAESGISINTLEDSGRVNLERNLSHYGDMGHVIAALNVGIEYKKATNVFLCDIESEEEANVYSIEDMKGYHRSCYLSPEHICAVLTVEDGKITDACTRDEFLERFQENGIGDYSVETGRGPERELGLEINCADSQERADDRIEIEEEELEY